MKRPWQLAVVLLSALVLPSLAAAVRNPDLDTWLIDDVVPYVRERLTKYPRFSGESVQFVLLRDDRVLASGNALALGLRDRLRDSLSVEPGIRVLQQTGNAVAGPGQHDFECSKREADYLVGIDVRQRAAGTIEVSVRALDRDDQSWVAGFSRHWQGPLLPRQIRAFRTPAVDPALRGERLAPWDDTEADLMASQLAWEIGCNLLRQSGSEYLLQPPADGSPDGKDLVELVSNNLAAVTYFQFAVGETSANARITGKAHRIDDDLYQYWITVVPLDPRSGLAVISADAYVRSTQDGRMALLVPEETYDLSTTPEPFLDEVSVVRLPNGQNCLYNEHRGTSRTSRSALRAAPYGGCFALQVSSHEDAVAFVLNHQLNHGLVRLATGRCSSASSARIVRNDASLRYPLPNLSVGSWLHADSWSLDPREDTYVVLASKNTRAARALAAHIDRLPGRCGESLQAGLEGAALNEWLDELNRIANHWQQSIDWRAVRIREVY